MKKVLVTGISKNIGKAICEKLVSEGYFVIGTYNTDTKSADNLSKSLKNIELHQVDFSDKQQTLNFVEKIKDHQFYAIVNNAAVIYFELFDDLTYDAWEKTIAVNLTAPLIISHGLRSNIEKNGSIVNIASTDGLKGTYASIAYSVSKAGLINLTKSLGNVFGSLGIRVNTVSPSWVGSGMDSPAVKDAEDTTPLGRIAAASEIADVVIYLISDKASYINGSNIIVDGGYLNVDPIIKREAEELEKEARK